LKLSKRTEYGLRAVIHLAKLGPAAYVQSRDLSGAEQLPNKFLEAILLALRRGGFLESKVGSGGGYKLARAPKDIRVGELIRRLEGRLTYREDAQPPAQDSIGRMAVRVVNQRLTRATDDALDALNLEELLDEITRAANQQQSMYYI